MSKREDEIAELQARLDALKEGRTATLHSGKMPKSVSRLIIGAAVVFVLAIPVITSLTPDERPTAANSDNLITCDPIWAGRMVSSAEETGIIERAEATSEGLIAMVDGRLFESLSYPAKEQIAVALDCRIAGDGRHLSSVRFRRSLHGEDLAEFRNVDLLRARTKYAEAGWKSAVR